jgi:Type II secretion system (T2SS), protein N
MSTLRKTLFAICLLFVATVVLLWRLPASSLLVFVPAKTMAQLSNAASLHDVRGTLWQGSARFTASAVPSTLELVWRCSPAFAQLAINCNLSGAANGSLQFAPFTSGGMLRIDSLNARQAISATVNPSIAATSESLAVALTRANLSRERVAIDGSAVARDAVYRVGNTTTELGEVFIDCKASNDGATTQCAVKNRASDARLDGTITLNARGASGAIELSSPGTPAQKISF